MKKKIPENGGWNYRIFKHKHPASLIKRFSHIKGYSPYYFGLHEAYYKKKGDKEPSSWSEKPEIVAESKSEMIAIVEMMLKDIKSARPCKRIIQD